MTVVYLGNEDPREIHHEETAPPDATEPFADGLVIRPRPDIGPTITQVGPFGEGASPLDMVSDVVGLWPYHGASPPTYVASDDDALAELLGRQFGCEVRPFEAAQAEHDALTGRDA